MIHRIGKKNCQQHESNSVTTIFIYGYTNLVKKEYTRTIHFNLYLWFHLYYLQSNRSFGFWELKKSSHWELTHPSS